MGTRAAAFTAKIHNLQHYNARIKHNLVPLPSGDDVANTLKYFTQTLLSVLKDVPSISLDMLRSPEKDVARTSLFPSLDYRGLHHVLVELVDCVPLVQHGAHAFGYTLLHTFACLVPFLEHELMDTLPYLVASMMTIFPCSLHKDIIDMLCNHLLPFTFREDTEGNDESYATMSTASVLMMVFQYTDCSAYHCQVLECFMAMKKNIVKDLLCVIAHGTAKARCHAVELLFQYLPTLNPALLDRKGIGWKSQQCQRDNCLSESRIEAVKMCFEHSIAIVSGEHPPPLFMCEACAEEVEKEHGSENIVDVLLPMDKVSATCEDPECKATDKSAVATCFSIECAIRNSHRPIRYCSQCVINYHNEKEGLNHMLHTTIPSPWNMDLETQSYMVEAVISLLREAEPLNEKHIPEPGNGQEDREESRELTVVEERQLLSRYGIWLLVGLCTPNENTPDEYLGRLLSMLFQWFHYTACLPDDQAGNALERLKAEYIHGWLMEVVKNHFDVFVSCLLPHPVDYAKIGGHWESWPSYPVQIKEGFKRLLCLVPYDIITPEVWEYIMPYWMDAFRHEAVEPEFAELKILLSKVLDPDLSPLGFDTKQMYRFLSIRFESPSSPVQEQALYWLQILTTLEVAVPLDLLYEMFSNGVASLICSDEKKEQSQAYFIPPHTQEQRGSNVPPSTSRSSRAHGTLADLPEDENPLDDLEYKSDSEINLHCYILMLDILIKQLELQEVLLHKGLEQKDAQKVLFLMQDLVKAPWVGKHTCSDTTEGIQCIFCELCAIFYQLSLTLVEYFSPVMEVTMADIPSISPLAHSKGESAVPYEDSSEKSKTDAKAEVGVSKSSPRADDNVSHHSIQSFFPDQQDDIVFTGHSSPIQTASVQECSVESDQVTAMPTEKVLTATAKEVTLTDDEVAGAKCTVSSPVLINGSDPSSSQTAATEETAFWHTTEGKFKFTIEELPPQLQLLYALLKDLAIYEDADVLYHILSCLKVMCLHSEILNKAAHNHRGFLIWCQENLLINNLWKLLQMEFSHIAQLATGLLLHSITLPAGSDMFWKIVEHDFHNKEWRARYAAVEKVTVIAHFVDASTVKNSPLLQSALANAFCYLIHCLDDEQPTISQRALLNLETVKTPSLKLFVWCLEVQFDCNILDRPMILQTIFQIHNHVTNKRFLTWDFFLGRFDTLYLEDQIILERLGEISYVRDLKNTNVNSEMFQKKLKRAQESLSHTSSTKSLTASFGLKMPYKRAMSAPGAISARYDKDKDKLYERQSSAPVLKRKSSRLVGSTTGALGPLQHFPNSFFTDGHLKDTVQEETHFLNVLHRAMDTEEHDKETLHLLVYLLMQFLAKPDPIHRSDDKVTRSQHIVLRHLNILLGYSQNQGEGRFLLPPHKVRASAVFSIFLMCMPKVLDYNFTMGNFLLTTCLSILTCCPSPQKYPSEHYPPTYSLWLLDAYCRHSWLQATLVILYKYHYDSYPYCRYIHWLILIVLNTLKAQRHRCKQIHEPLLSPLPSRSRDFSTPSADMDHGLEKDKDGVYETVSLHEDTSKYTKSKGPKFSEKSDEFAIDQNQKQMGKDKSHQWKWKSSEKSCSSEGEDAEPELEAIPESPKSESSETEQFPSDLACLSQRDEQACSNLVSEPYVTDEHIVITSTWLKSTDEATLVSNSDSLNITLQDEKYQSLSDAPQSSSETETVSVVEKSAVEIMEKNIEKTFVAKEDVVTSADSNVTEKASYDEQIKSNANTTTEAPTEILASPKRESKTSGENHLSKETQKSQLVAHESFFDRKIPLSKQRSVGSIPEPKEDVTRIRSLPFDYQNVSRSKTDCNILDLPQSDDEKMLYSRYPRSKQLQSKKTISYKSSRKAEMLSSENLTVPIFRPPLERLLPIGMSEKEKEKPKRTDTLTVMPQNYSEHIALRAHMPCDVSIGKESQTSKDLCEDKGVQTGSTDHLLDIPAQERLLPVGPIPLKKDWYPSPVSKSNVGVTAIESEIKSAVNVNVEPKANQHTELSASDTINANIETAFVKQSKDKMAGIDLGLSKSTDSLKINKSDIEDKTIDKKPPEPTEMSALGAIASENLKKILDLTPDMSQSMSAFGVFDICKKAMEDEMNEQDGKQSKDSEIGNRRNSSSSAEQLFNEKGEAFAETHDGTSIQKSLEKAFEEEVKCRLPYRQRKQRKAGLTALEAQRSFDYQNAGARRLRKVEMGSITSVSKRSSTSQSSNPRSEDVVIERCNECGVVVEEYSDEEIGLCIVILATFVHREPAMAAPLLPKMLRIVARIAASPTYPWQNESNIHLPGGSVSVARQFLRCTLHQLASNGVFVQIFQSHTIEAEFFKTMAAALADFTEVNQITPLLMLFENLNDRKHLHHEIIFHVLDNVAIYLDCLPLESTLPQWPAFLQQLDLFLRKFLLTLAVGPVQMNSILQIILCALKLPVINGVKSILDPFSKILSHAIQHSALDYQQLLELCHACFRNMSRERDKLVLTRTAIFELVQALKFKSSVPDANLLILVQFVLDDSEGSLGPNVILEGIPINFESQNVYKTHTSAGECMRQYLNDALEFVADVHTLNKVKNMLYGNSTHLNEETLGGHLKAGIAQYLAIEISKGNGRDNRAIGRYLPWLYHPPTTLQQGPKEFIDCVSHIRLLSWLLLGALIHSALMQNAGTLVCQPIPLEANGHIAEHIQVILAGFSEQSKVSVLHMSSLFHAFILCQLWTMYCEHMVALNPPGSEQNQLCGLTLTDFWAKVTPGILQLVCHSKVEEYPQLAEMVSLHFLSLMEALQECNSTVLARLLPMWTPVLYSFQGQIPGNLHLRLHACVSCQPPSLTKEDTASVSTTFLRWLQRLQFKMGQIELQSSTAIQFYSL